MAALNRLQNCLNDDLWYNQEHQREMFSEVYIQTMLGDATEPKMFVKSDHCGLFALVGTDGSVGKERSSKASSYPTYFGIGSLHNAAYVCDIT